MDRRPPRHARGTRTARDVRRLLGRRPRQGLRLHRVEGPPPGRALRRAHVRRQGRHGGVRRVPQPARRAAHAVLLRRAARRSPRRARRRRVGGRAVQDLTGRRPNRDAGPRRQADPRGRRAALTSLIGFTFFFFFFFFLCYCCFVQFVFLLHEWNALQGERARAQSIEWRDDLGALLPGGAGARRDRLPERPVGNRRR